MLATVNRLPAVSTPRAGFALSDPFWGAQQEFDRWFDRIFNGGAGLYAHGLSAPLCVWEDEGAVHLELDMPGVAKEDLEIVVHQGALRISGERKAPGAEENKQYYINERRYGRFERSIALPEGLDTDSVTAELRDGVLYVTLTKRPEAQPKRITVQAG